LRRKAQRPEPAEHFWNRVGNFFADWDNEVEIRGGAYLDIDFVQQYCQHVAISFEAYQSLLRGAPDETLLATEMFKDYQAGFDNLNEIKKLKESKPFKAKTLADQQSELNKRFLVYLQAIEKQKLYYFILARHNPQKVLLVKSPSDNKEQKQFLGYEWSGAKGNEGIKYNGGETVYDMITPMFNPNDRGDVEKVNFYIQQNFLGNAFDIPEQLQPVMMTTRLEDLLDFSRKEFNRALSLTPQKNTTVETKWEWVKLGKVAEVIAGQSPESINYNELGNGLPFYQGKKDFGERFLNDPTVWTTQITKEAIKNDILMSVRAPVGDINLNPLDKICIGRGLAAIRGNSEVYQRYLFEIIHQNKSLIKGNQGMVFESVSRNDLIDIKIPLPPLSVQQQIVAECEAIESAVSEARKLIDEAKAAIEQLVSTTHFPREKLDNLVTKIGENIDPQSLNGEVNYIGLENIESHTGNLVGNIIAEYQTIKSAKTCFKQNDILYGKLRPNLNKVYLAKENGICSTDILVFRFSCENLARFYAHYFLSKAFNQEVLKSVTGQQLPRTSWADMKEIKIPVPSFSDQEKLMAELEILEQSIRAARQVIDNAGNQKQVIMKKYL
jgi:restriction endonuclease S subunit